jgi:hypothetical protein
MRCNFKGRRVSKWPTCVPCNQRLRNLTGIPYKVKTKDLLCKHATVLANNAISEHNIGHRMTELTILKMDIGFAICAVCTFAWASIDYNRFIKFWMRRPAPYSTRVRIAFRLFFAACVIGGSWQVVDGVITSGLPVRSYIGTLPFAVGWFAVVYVMVRAVERMNRKRPANQPRTRQL